MLLQLFFLSIFAFRQHEAKDLSKTRLTGIQAKHIYKLFQEGNVSLIFDVNQQPNSRALLFRFSSAANPSKSNLYLLSETTDTKNHLTLRLGKEIFTVETGIYNQNFHRIHLLLGHGHFQIIVDCVKIADSPFNTHNIPGHQKKLVLDVGVSPDDSSVFPGHIREFSADTPQATHMRCADIILSRQPRLERSLAEADAAELEEERGVQTNTVNEDGDQIAELEERVKVLEDEVEHFRSYVSKFDKRIQTVELHQRGCMVDGHLLHIGQKQPNYLNCSQCQCSASGELHCGPIGCPHLKCAHPFKPQGNCCPVCGKQCYYNGNNYEHGAEIWPKQCVRCRCDHGRMECQFHRPENCPKLDCVHQETPTNQCCPVCVNVDYCAGDKNPCHPNAECVNGQYKAECRCKEGFFGNGTTCYDIDECLWDMSAREQLGGCEQGTICINLPGTFKCDCLPGFQRLDDRHCLDLIRI
ncbi:unnamed protein product [Bursaphelenchus xylophilus]|uniref:(pine wood nematode) hypothetical protein n=1 Tax=Bursaphelenchus xylophilus TaxID=6326 RepID=A0A1I7SQW5_BURXY|nr:unnamed protein product [Bursaphelenchus xylophilus]CAG9110485.1 unnamed protein product [Bursaphelenchus xylophilus]